MRVVSVVGAKGGVGASTLAAALSVKLAGDGLRVALLSADGAAVLGAAEPWSFPCEVVSGVSLVDTLPGWSDVPVVAGVADRVAGSGWDVVVVDNGTEVPGSVVVRVARADYLSLRRLSVLGDAAAVVVFRVECSALSAGDAERVARGPVIAGVVDAAVARSVDAGLLAGRLPRSLGDVVAALAVRLELSGVRS